MSHSADNRRNGKPCVICGRPSKWRHHVAGRANAPQVTCEVCRRHADVLDGFLSLAGVKLKHGEPRTDAELVWAAIAGLDGLRAARDGKPELSPVALAAVRVLAARFADVRGPRPAATDARHRKRQRPAAAASFESARARAVHDLLAMFPEAAERLPGVRALVREFADNAQALETVSSQAVEQLYPDFERAAVELLDACRLAAAGHPDAQGVVALAERRFVQAAGKLGQAIACAPNGRASSGEALA